MYPDVPVRRRLRLTPTCIPVRLFRRVMAVVRMVVPVRCHSIHGCPRTGQPFRAHGATVSAVVPAAVAHAHRIVPAAARYGHLVLGAMVAEPFATAATVMLLQTQALEVADASFAVLFFFWGKERKISVKTTIHFHTNFPQRALTIISLSGRQYAGRILSVTHDLTSFVGCEPTLAMASVM